LIHKILQRNLAITSNEKKNHFGVLLSILLR